MHVFAGLHLEVVEHLLERSSVDAVCDSKATIFLLLFGYYIQICLVCVPYEPIYVNNAVQEEDE